MDSWLTVLPPLGAIVLAILTRQVFISLFLGIWVGWTILAGWNPLAGLADALASLVNVFQSGYNTRVILFSALVGALITLTQRSGGVQGFIEWMQSLNLGRTRRSASLVAYITGWLVFVESSITCLVVGAVARPLSDRVRMSREKLAYICDSTSAPVCILIPLNAWGAYIMGLLVQQGIEHPLPILLETIPLNFYAWSALALTLLVILTGKDFGPMRAAERRAQREGKLLADGALPMISSEVIAMPPKDGVVPRRRNMLLPLATMILMMPVGLYLTGRSAILQAHREALQNLPRLEFRQEQIANMLLETWQFSPERQLEPEALEQLPELLQEKLGEYQSLVRQIETLREKANLEMSLFTILGEGSGATAVFWAVLAAIFVAGLLYLEQGIMTLHELVDLVLKGAGGLVPMATLMMLAFSINETCNELGTGEYVASVAEGLLRPGLIPAVLFAVSCFIAFSTGTSWGTFGIMMPIGVPLALATGGSLPITVAAILGGGVFGDHCSPVSDTTVISSMATACDHVDHVKTQLPYALTAALVALAGFLLAGWLFY